MAVDRGDPSEPLVFLSYPDRLQGSADVLSGLLAEVGVRPWSTARDVKLGEDWKDAVAAALEQSAAVVALFDGADVGAWQLSEIEQRPSSARLVPIAVGPDAVIPSSLSRYQGAAASSLDDFHGLARRIAAAIDVLDPLVTLPEEPPADLLDAMRKRECVLVAGDGLEAMIGGLATADVARQLLAWAGEQKLTDERRLAAMDANLRRGDVELVIDAITALAPSGPLDTFVAGRLGSAPISVEPLSALARLPFAAALTLGISHSMAEVFSSRLPAAHHGSAAEETLAGAVTSLVILKDGVIVSGGADGYIRFWDPGAQAELSARHAHSGGVSAVANHPDTLGIATAGADGFVKLWQGQGTGPAFTLEGHAGPVNALAFGPSGVRYLLASGGDDGVIRLWNGITGKPRDSLQTGTGPVRALAIGRVGRETAVIWGADDGLVHLWYSTRDAQSTLHGHEGPVLAVAGGGPGASHAVVSAGADGTIRLWNPVNSTQVAQLSGHSGSVLALDARRAGAGPIISAGEDGNIVLWNASTGEVLHRIKLLGPVSLRAVASGRANGREILAWGGDDGAVRLLDIDDDALDSVPQRLRRKRAPTESRIARIPELPRASETERLLSWHSQGEFFIVHLAGRLEDGTLALTLAQSGAAISRHRELARFLASLVTTRRLFILGLGLDRIETLLSALTTGAQDVVTDQPRHYAVVEVRDPGWEARADVLLHRHGVRVLPFTGPGLEPAMAFVDRLAAELEGDAEPVGAEATPSQVLSRIELTGVGPFPDLKLGFEPGVNVLLGDNGTGKSTILRAVATALCGEAARPWAERVIRAGGSFARIALHGEQSPTCSAELYRTSAGAEMTVTPPQPLQAGRVLVIGFPAIRSFVWGRLDSSAPDAGRERPTEADLLPLITGEPDPRPDQLKRWIFDLDHARARLDPADQGGSRPDRILDDIFRVLGHLATGLDVRFDRVDIEARQVLVQTTDGVIPLEALSQGVSALLGWVATLVRRLHDVYGAQHAQPLEAPALVLVDEIDAHMHPSWQQQIVPLLTKLFPNCQFVLATHSPLLVTGLDVNRVTRLERDADGVVRVVPIDADMTMGRADQILTSPLFGLRTTLDVTTAGRLDRYGELLAKAEREPSDERELEELAADLRHRIPVPYEMPAERRAAELVRMLLRAQVGDAYEEVQEDLLGLARQLLTEAGRETRA